MATQPWTVADVDLVAVEYPESDGKPMAETEVHLEAMIEAREILQDFFADDPQVYVGANMLLYYERGRPQACTAPDVFVVRGIPKQVRRTYKVWEEGQPPTMVLEVTSRSTRLEDLGYKRALYLLLKVQEYFLFDPLGDYLKPRLQGYRLVGSEYEPIPAGADGSLLSQALGLRLVVEKKRLRWYHQATGERLLTRAERAQAEAERAQAEAERAQAEAERAQAAEARAQAAEAQASAEREARRQMASELERLKAELARLQGKRE